ncbi:hypothetical protein HOY80DRAFT_886738, partial [Tuber brumale]
NFELPIELAAGDAISAWTWFNREREMQMSCPPVTIQQGSPLGGEELSEYVVGYSGGGYWERMVHAYGP